MTYKTKAIILSHILPVIAAWLVVGALFGAAHAYVEHTDPRASTSLKEVEAK